MKKTFILMLGLCMSVTAYGQSEKPKIIVGIVVDQLKQEYLWRFENDFGDAGFRRIMTQGFVAKNGQYNYATTSTGPGHASIYTGSTPSVHGIVNNSWYSRKLKRSVYCAEDTAAMAIGGSERAGKISPANLYSSTITDELKMFTQQRGKVIAMSIKDRGSALPGGHLSDGSYWYDSETGAFMTSSYYMEELPRWVKRFNDENYPAQYLSMTWDLAKDEDVYTESGEDNSPYERGFRGKESPTFPYNLAELNATNGGYSMLPSTPWGNTILTDLALEAMDNEDLGEDDITDFLAISYSSTDYIGHNFGPQSKEVQDTYIRLDMELERLFAELDKKVGEGNYVIFLTADHAVAENSIRMKDLGFRADNLNSRGFGQYLNQAMLLKYGDGEWLETAGSNPFLNHDLLKEKGIDLYEAQLFLSQKAMEYEGVYLALTGTDLIRHSYSEKMRSLMQAAYHPKESGDVKIILDAAWQTGGSKGTSHGTPWTYDTHVPIMFYGWGINQGSSVREIYITDIAPTISMMMKMRLPNGATGQPIHEALK